MHFIFPENIKLTFYHGYWLKELMSKGSIILIVFLINLYDIALKLWCKMMIYYILWKISFRNTLLLTYKLKKYLFWEMHLTFIFNQLHMKFWHFMILSYKSASCKYWNEPTDYCLHTLQDIHLMWTVSQTKNTMVQ